MLYNNYNNSCKSCFGFASFPSVLKCEQREIMLFAQKNKFGTIHFFFVFESLNSQKEKRPTAHLATVALKMEVDWLQF